MILKRRDIQNRDNMRQIIILISILLVVISALVPQISYLLLAEQVFRFGILRNLIMPIILVLILLTSKNMKLISSIFIPSFIFVLYLSISMILNINKFNANYIVNGYTGFYAFFVLIPFFSLLIPILSEKRVTNFFTVSAVICAVLGIFQFCLNQPLLTTKDESENFEILSWLFYSGQGVHVRGFSFFYNALDFGVFLIFMLGIVLFRARINYFNYLIFIILVFAIFSTITRNVYVGAILAVLGFFAYKLSRSYRLLMIIPPLLFTLIVLVSNLFSFSNNTGITNIDNLVTRNYYWNREIKRQERNGIIDLLFGQGIYQEGDENSNGLLFVDNTYLQIVAQIGIIGLIIFLLLYFSLLRYVIVQRERDAIGAGFYGFLVAWPTMAMYNIIIMQLAVYTLIMFLTYSNSQHKALDIGE